jgi:hypothetical protein
VFKELKVSGWEEELSRALEYRKSYGLENSWKDNEALFYSVHPSLANAGPNLIVSTGDALLSALVESDPAMLVSPATSGDVLGARMLEALDNDLLEDLGLSEEMEIAALHCFLYGKGIFKIGYDSEWGWDESFGLGRKKPLGLSLTQFDSKGQRIEFREDIRPGMPWVRAVLPHDILVPWGVRSCEDAPWIAHRVVRHVEDVKADVKYSGTRDLQPVMSMKDFMKSYTTVPKPLRVGHTDFRLGEGSSNVEFVELFEIHDRRTGKIYVIATGHDKFLRNDTDLLQTKGLPFVDFSFIPAARSFWVTPDALYLNPQQAELSDITLQAAKQRRLSVVKAVVKDGAMSDTQISLLTSPDVGGVVKTSNGEDPRTAVAFMTPSNNNMLLYQDAEAVRRDAREMVGFSRNQMGEYEASGRRTAREATIVQMSSSSRLTRREKIVKNAYRKLMMKINSLIFDLWTTPRWVEFMGVDGARKWAEVTGSQLRGNYRYKVDFTASGERLKARRIEALGMYQTLMMDPAVNQMKLREMLELSMNDPEFTGLFSGQEAQSQGQGQAPQETSNAGV